MNRLDLLRRYTTKADLGIEIAPYFNPIVTKAAGYNVMIVDVFDTATLRQRVLDDPLIPDSKVGDVESVDFVSDASDLLTAVEARGLVGQFAYIVSSHNFEHLPNPVRFLQGCSAALRPGGMLTMAIPDYRACFDHFRMPTRLSDWLAAYHRGYTRPAPETRFDFRADQSMYMRDGVATVGCDIAIDDPAGFLPSRVMRHAYAEYLADLAAPPPYKDAHCSAVCGTSFELMVRDLRHLGVIDLEVAEVVPTLGLEFFVHLRKPQPGTAPEDDETYYRRRAGLQRALNAQLGSAGFGTTTGAPLPPLGQTEAKRMVRRLIGQGWYDRLVILWRRRVRA